MLIRPVKCGECVCKNDIYLILSFPEIIYFINIKIIKNIIYLTNKYEIGGVAAYVHCYSAAQVATPPAMAMRKLMRLWAKDSNFCFLL